MSLKLYVHDYYTNIMGLVPSSNFYTLQELPVLRSRVSESPTSDAVWNSKIWPDLGSGL